MTSGGTQQLGGVEGRAGKLALKAGTGYVAALAHESAFVDRNQSRKGGARGLAADQACSGCGAV